MISIYKGHPNTVYQDRFVERYSLDEVRWYSKPKLDKARCNCRAKDFAVSKSLSKSLVVCTTTRIRAVTDHYSSINKALRCHLLECEPVARTIIKELDENSPEVSKEADPLKLGAIT